MSRQKKHRLGEIYTVYNDEKKRLKKHSAKKKLLKILTPKKHRLGEIYTVFNDENIKG